MVGSWKINFVETEQQGRIFLAVTFSGNLLRHITPLTYLQECHSWQSGFIPFSINNIPINHKNRNPCPHFTEDTTESQDSLCHLLKVTHIAS